MKIPGSIKNVLGYLGLGAFMSCTNYTPPTDYTGYQPASGKVSYVYKGRVTNFGYRGPAYRVMFTPPGQSAPVTVDGHLSLKKYQQGDSVQIFYNPKNPEDEVTDIIK